MNAYEAHRIASDHQPKEHNPRAFAELCMNLFELKSCLDTIASKANLGYYNCTWNLYHSSYEENVRNLILDMISCKLQTMGYKVSLSDPYLNHGKSLWISW